MNVHRNIIILIAATAVLIAVIIAGLSYVIDLKPSLSEQEKKFSHFHQEKTQVTDRKPLLLSGLRNPMQVKDAEDRDYPPQSLADLAPTDNSKTAAKDGGKEGDQEKKKKKQGVSLILINDHSKIAVIDGVVVKEGDTTKDGRIKMIRKDGILVRNSEGEKWLRIE